MTQVLKVHRGKQDLRAKVAHKEPVERKARAEHRVIQDPKVQTDLRVRAERRV